MLEVDTRQCDTEVPSSQQLGMMLMLLGIPELTDETIPDAWARIHALEAMGHDLVNVTLDELKSFRGARANVNPQSYDDWYQHQLSLEKQR